jgi:hypothetical protein|tara:strand:- start:1376 stop:1816 length:441 start_codon:yes stop_codon:yes gene_type:complete
MGLQSKIKDIFLESTGAKEYAEGDTGNIDTMAEKLTDAIVEYFEAQTFIITSLSADLKIDKLTLLRPLPVDVSKIFYISPAGPAPVLPQSVASIKSTTLIDGTDIAASGRAYLGEPAKKIRGSDRTEEWNTYATVKLNPSDRVDVD